MIDVHKDARHYASMDIQIDVVQMSHQIPSCAAVESWLLSALIIAYTQGANSKDMFMNT
jgi:hypothetical protein